VRNSSLLTLSCCALLWPSSAAAQDLIVNNTTVTLGGIHTYDKVEVTNNGKIVVPKFDGSNKVSTGNLQLVANSILVDATSLIVADGAGYQPKLCDNGPGPTATAGGRGGCAVLDSGGGGAHFGPGGRGTKDCDCVSPTSTCQFPQEFEEDCGYLNASGTGCVAVGGAPGGVCPPATGTCFTYDGLPSVAGVPYWHSVYEVEFGAAGGDKGCRDGWDSCLVAGAGGGRIVLAAVNASKTGVLDIRGRVSAEGHRGCGHGNDSGGGGAGGTLLLVGDTVTVASTAQVSVAGALGGDTNAKQPGSTCPSCAQAPGGTCDDCGGGGGGGIISVLAGQPASISSLALFYVGGAEGGTCTICKGEAGGGAGELQLNGVYVGEFCDGYDNDFDGQVDENLGTVSCGTGACQQSVAQCNTQDPNDVFPNDCVPLSTPSCQPPLTDARGRFLLIVDTSGSMLTDLSGNYTFGDGSVGHPGLDTSGDGQTGDSRLYKAKDALTKVIAAYPEIDMAMARFAQGVDTKVNCQLAHWFECAGLCCTYDNPSNNTGGTPPAGPCVVTATGAAGPIVVQPTSPGEECINYAGSCGQPRRGADIIVGFEKSIGQKLMWLDHKETNFIKDTTEGNHCSYATGGDCELRGTGPTPLAGSLYAAKAYLAAAKASDQIASCRPYAVILLTDGAETCNADPKAAAAELLAAPLGIETYVIGFSVLPGEKAELNAIAHAGSVGGTRNAFFVGDENQLAATLASIVADSVLFEKCNGLDDDCDLLIDEDWPLKGTPCDNGKLGICYKTGTYVCKPDGTGLYCDAPDVTGTPEICNGLDDDCNGAIDDIKQSCTTNADCAAVGTASCISGSCVCQLCAAQPEVCDNKDNDCNGLIDDNIATPPCGTDIGECTPGTYLCINGQMVCDGGTGPTAEVCNGLDDNCDGLRDGMTESCYTHGDGNGCANCPGSTSPICAPTSPPGWNCLGYCKPGLSTCNAVQNADGSWSGVWGNCLGEVGPGTEVCNLLDDDCDGDIDEEDDCPPGSQCINGQCSLPCDTGEFVCPKGQICVNGYCVLDPCDADACAKKGWVCKNGVCVDPCENKVCTGKYEKCIGGICVDTSCYNPDYACPSGQVCVQGECKPDPCDPAVVTCGTDEYCVDGQCVKLCSALTCGPGEICKVVQENGVPVARCVKDPCAGVDCGEGRICKDGVCEDDPCFTVHCETGEICVDGACVPDPCETIDCPSGFECRKGTCIPSNVSGNIDLLATGAGGCACDVAPVAGPPWPWLLLLGLWLVARPRRRR
jgi:hypothetical protein